jgi:hypothetical protein
LLTVLSNNHVLTRVALAAVLATAFSAQAASDQPYPGTIVLKVDASNTAQNIFRVRESIPAKPGKLTLLYPQWIPGNHGPSGALSQFAGLKVSANGQPLEWKRDPVNVFAFHINVPKARKAWRWSSSTCRRWRPARAAPP